MALQAALPSKLIHFWHPLVAQRGVLARVTDVVLTAFILRWGYLSSSSSQCSFVCDLLVFPFQVLKPCFVNCLRATSILESKQTPLVSLLPRSPFIASGLETDCARLFFLTSLGEELRFRTHPKRDINSTAPNIVRVARSCWAPFASKSRHVRSTMTSLVDVALLRSPLELWIWREYQTLSNNLRHTKDSS